LPQASTIGDPDSYLERRIVPGVLVAPERLKAKSAQLQLGDPDSLLERRGCAHGAAPQERKAAAQLWPSCF